MGENRPERRPLDGKVDRPLWLTLAAWTHRVDCAGYPSQPASPRPSTIARDHGGLPQYPIKKCPLEAREAKIVIGRTLPSLSGHREAIFSGRIESMTVL